MDAEFFDRIKQSARASPAEVVLLALLGLAIAGGTALVFFRQSEPPAPQIKRISSAKLSGHAEAGPTHRPPAGTLLVHVAGSVVSPGVYELPEGSRTKDAVAAAGGPKDGGDVDALNLAAPLSDGQKITVGKPGEPVPPSGVEAAGASGGGLPAPAKINLNAATQAELETLPSIGPVLAQRILAVRQQKGKFTSVAQLKDVEGIGPKKFDSLKDLVTL